MTLPSGFLPFNEDRERTPEDRQRGRDNRTRVLQQVVRHAARHRPLTADGVAGWHRDTLDGLSYVPDPCYLGGYRGGPHPWLFTYEVQVAGWPGVRAADVAAELAVYFDALNQRLIDLEVAIPASRPKSLEDLEHIAELAAWAHGEWVRIHPFVNGNGRTARYLANFVLAWFSLAPCVRLRPRPSLPYDDLAEASMLGDHSPTALWLLSLLQSPQSQP